MHPIVTFINKDSQEKMMTALVLNAAKCSVSFLDSFKLVVTKALTTANAVHRHHANDRYLPFI